MIYNVIDYFQLYKISQLIDSGEFKDIEFTANTFFHYLIDNFDKDRIQVFVNVEDKEIDGFVICSLSQDVVTQRNEVFIDLTWIKKGTDGNIGKELLEKVEDYARKLNLTRISGFTLRGEQKAMFAKYGFRPYSTIMVKDLNGKERIAEIEAGAEPKSEEKSEKSEEKRVKHNEQSRKYYQKHRAGVLQKRKQNYKIKKEEVKKNAVKKA